MIHGFRDFHTRTEAGQALRDMGPTVEPEVLAILKEGDLKGRDLFLKRDAILVLKDIGTEASVPALREAARNGGLHLSGPARDALAAIAQRQKP